MLKAYVLTDLNYLWKVKAVGDAYLKEMDISKDSPAGMHLVITTYTDDTRINGMWEDGMLCL
jgi:hypothetical protein